MFRAALSATRMDLSGERFARERRGKRFWICARRSRNFLPAFGLCPRGRLSDHPNPRRRRVISRPANSRPDEAAASTNRKRSANVRKRRPLSNNSRLFSDSAALCRRRADFPAQQNLSPLFSVTCAPLRSRWSQRDRVRIKSRNLYRARTTSFFVQVCTFAQCAQLSLCDFTFLSAQSSSSITWPVAVSFAVVGQRTRILFVMEVEAFARRRVL